jgi:hypothetical protein
VEGPGWLITLVFTLASKLSWSEDFILWKLPLERALQYWHAAVFSAGGWTVPISKAPKIDPIALKAAVDAAAQEDGWD